MLALGLDQNVKLDLWLGQLDSNMVLHILSLWLLVEHKIVAVMSNFFLLLLDRHHDMLPPQQILFSCKYEFWQIFKILRNQYL